MSVADMAALLSNTPQVPIVNAPSQEQPPPERAVQDAAAALGQLSQGTGDNPLAVLLSHVSYLLFSAHQATHFTSSVHPSLPRLMIPTRPTLSRVFLHPLMLLAN